MGYRDGEPQGIKHLGTGLGCTSAFLFTVVISFPLLFGMVWAGAHCDPVPECQRESERLFAMEMAPVLCAALLIGLAVRWAIHRLAARRVDGGASVIFAAAATVMTLVATAATVRATFAAIEALYLPVVE